MRPPYITSTRVAISAITAMSWLISSTPARRSSRTLRSSISTSRWTVTSSAVVGSSATTSTGSAISPMPIAARWRMPPENSCGYWRARRSGSAIWTARSRSTARSSAALRLIRWWTSETSASWRPTRSAGLSADIGSWKTIASDVPRNRSRAAGGSSRSALPASSWTSARATPG